MASPIVEKMAADLLDDTVIDAIKVHLNEALRSSMFSNRMRISPRRLGEIAEEETLSVAAFVTLKDRERVEQRGYTLAHEGLGHQAILNVCARLRMIWRDSNIHLTAPTSESTEDIEAYTGAVLEGYMRGREDEVKREQERTRAAYLRTLAYDPEG
jgi:hypothetical protein